MARTGSTSAALPALPAGRCTVGLWPKRPLNSAFLTDGGFRPYDSVLRGFYTPLLVPAETRAALQAKIADFRPHPREHFIPLFATPPEAVAHYQALADAGIQYFLVAPRRTDLETIRLLATRVMPEIQPAARAGGESEG